MAAAGRGLPRTLLGVQPIPAACRAAGALWAWGFRGDWGPEPSSTASWLARPSQLPSRPEPYLFTLMRGKSEKCSTAQVTPPGRGRLGTCSVTRRGPVLSCARAREGEDTEVTPADASWWASGPGAFVAGDALRPFQVEPRCSVTALTRTPR